ncbi:acylneuraminate cytidylyltransferase family protein [Malaciobacter marinus]|uniref:Acylneuraminate cytidylyltransferase n=1 Tax=Malaciobacter marinus TaxID=505249 RepID=A0A347TM13_9BACT|nr:acylneuraminate cytidylyltransferase family protein [Malaciobacter marinus]AXX87641.1 acylneuraminate cytidylyltransferase family protein [Malaciobacter marinus]PHO15110.1 acylneuraminate cytidylyltransferase [Malaciobacter marinus]
MKNKKEIIAFLPMRKGSQRIKNKNIKKFANIKKGLTFIKISQLLKVKEIDKIIVSTDDKKVIDIALSFDSKKIHIDKRPKELATSSTSTDELIKYVPKIIKKGIVIWTHVTSPFIDEKIYSKMIKTYLDNKNNDSLMSVTKIQKFLWDKKNPINYNRKKEKWPRTQTLNPVYEVNSGAFINEIKNYKKFNDRIGKNPILFELDTIQSFDIDWKEDFEIAQVLWEKYYNFEDN